MTALAFRSCGKCGAASKILFRPLCETLLCTINRWWRREEIIFYLRRRTVVFLNNRKEMQWSGTPLKEASSHRENFKLYTGPADFLSLIICMCNGSLWTCVCEQLIKISVKKQNKIPFVWNASALFLLIIAITLQTREKQNVSKMLKHFNPSLYKIIKHLHIFCRPTFQEVFVAHLWKFTLCGVTNQPMTSRLSLQYLSF